MRVKLSKQASSVGKSPKAGSVTAKHRLRQNGFWIYAKSLVPYRQCSACEAARVPRVPLRSTVDTAIWSGPLAFAADAVILWGLNRFSLAICRIIKS